MKKILFITFFLIYISKTFAQSNNFQRLFFNIYNKSSAVNIIEMDNKEYVALSESTYSNDFITKLDSNGNPLWMKDINLANGSSGFLTHVRAGIKTTSNHLVLVTSVWNPAANTKQGACIKLTSNGDTVWSKIINLNTSGPLGGADMTSVIETNDKGFALLAYSFTIGPVSTTPTIVKLDSSGNIQWSSSLNIGINSLGYSIKQDLNNNYLVAGLRSNFPSINGFLVKLSSSGQIKWSKELNGVEGLDMSIQSNAYTILVETVSNIGLIKTDTAGTILWKKIYALQRPTSGTLNSGTTSFKRLHNGQYIIANGDGENYKNDVIIFDSLGNDIIGANFQLKLKNIIETSDYQYMVIGDGPIYYPSLLNKSFGDNELGIVKTSYLTTNFSKCRMNSSAAAGTLPDSIIFNPIFVINSGGLLTTATFHPSVNTISYNSDTTCISIGGGLDSKNKNTLVTIYPNPSKGHFTIRLDDYKTGTLSIYNTLGQTILERSIASKTTTVNLENQPKGIYHYILKLNNHSNFFGKIVID
jgi:hypothetical protein